MTDRERTLAAIDLFCTKNNLLYVVIGGYAAIAYGVQRYTKDIDITIAIGLDEIRQLGKKLLEDDFESRKDNPLEFFERNFVLPTRYKPTRIPVDFAAGVSEFDKNAVRRSRTMRFGTRNVPVCSPEDLIIYKLIAGRQLDLYDVELLFKFHKDTLDAKYLTETVQGFTEIERGDVFESVQALIQKYLRS